MRLADHSVSLKAQPVNALIGLEQTTRFTGGHDFVKKSEPLLTNHFYVRFATAPFFFAKVMAKNIDFE